MLQTRTNSATSDRQEGRVGARRTWAAPCRRRWPTSESVVTCCGIFIPLPGCRARVVPPDCTDKTAAWHTVNTQRAGSRSAGFLSGSCSEWLASSHCFITQVWKTQNISGVIFITKCCLLLSVNLLQLEKTFTAQNGFQRTLKVSRANCKWRWTELFSQVWWWRMSSTH